MKNYQQIIDLCKKEFGELVLYTDISSDDTGPTLFIALDASREEEITAFYPCIEDGKIKTYESYSNVLNLYLHTGNNAHYYYKGSVETNKDGKKYADDFDGDGAEYIAETVFSCEIRTPEEAVEWLQFIYRYRRTSEDCASIDVQRTEKPVEHWLEEPLVFLPGFSSSLVPLKIVSTKFNVYDLPELYNDAYHIGKLELKDFDNDFDKYSEAIRELNQKGQARMQELEAEFKELASKENNPLQPGDFLLYLGSNSFVTTYHTFLNNALDNEDCYFIVLRPVKDVSYASLHDFLTLQKEGIDFVKRVLSQEKNIPSTLEYIPDLEAQQYYVLQKKTGWSELQQLISRLKNTPMGFGEAPALINECLRTVKELSKNTRGVTQ